MDVRDYVDFELRVSRVTDGYEASASSGDLGGTEVFFSPFRGRQLEEWIGDLGTVYRDLAPAGVADPPSAQEIGRRIFETVFTGKLRRIWDHSLSLARQSGKGLRLRLNLRTPELWSWPWELLYDPDSDFLALRPETPIVRSPEIPLPVPPRQSKLPLQVLVVTSHPRGLHPLDAHQEWKRLEEALSRNAQVGVRLMHGTTLSKLRQAVRESFDIFHFIGHGGFERRSGRGALLFEKKNGEPDPVTGRDLARILRQQALPGLVVLNACEGGRAGPEDPFAGVAQRLVQEGIPAVVAMQTKVADKAATIFSQSFYEALAEGQPVERAVYEARQALFSERFGTEWGNPVLYMRSSTGKIFDLSRLVAPEVAASEATSGSSSKASSKAKRGGLWAVALTAVTLGGGYWALTVPDRSSDPACPSPKGLDIPFVKIEPGEFLMGKDQRHVKISRPFCMSRFEITQGQWQAVMGPMPDQATKGDDLPVGNVSWLDAQGFLAKLNFKARGARYRLPSEAKWEYAARAGTSGRFSFDGNETDLPRYGNCGKSGKLTPIGSFRKNPWGLYDMYGNVSEWMADWYGPLPEGSVVDPIGPTTGTEKVRRGGSFNYEKYCDGVYRSSSKPDTRNEAYGFRIIRDPISTK